MGSTKGFLVTIVLSSFCLALVESFPGKEEWSWKKHKLDLKCSGSEVKPPKNTTAWMTVAETCRDQAGGVDGKMPNSMSTEQKYCIMVCMGKGLGLIDANGNLSKDTFKATIQEVFPAAKTEELIAGVNDCVDEAGATVANGDCGSYREFMGCSLIKAMKICEYIPHFLLPHHDFNES